MSRFFIFCLWVLCLVVDGVVLPGLGITQAGVGPIVFLAAFLAAFGVRPWTIGWGIFFALGGEIFLGLGLGTLIISWLITVGVWHAVNGIINVPSVNERSSWGLLAPLTASALGLWIVFQAVYWLIVKLIYDQALPLASLTIILSSPGIILLVVIEIAILIAAYIILPRKNHV